MQYQYESSGNKKPAGCYYKVQEPTSKVYFNPVIDPSLTSLDGVDRGGVCTATAEGIVIFFSHTILTHFESYFMNFK